MSDLGNVSFGSGIKDTDIQKLTESIKELSKQIQEIKSADREESLKLEKYKQEAATLEFILTTGGLIVGVIIWLGSQSIGIMIDSHQEVILYKHTIAFIQEKTEE